MADLPQFQFQTTIVAPAAISGGGAAPALGIQGGGAKAGIQLFTQGIPDGAGDASLPAFLAQQFEPAMQKARQERYWQGFTEARAGKSMQEIHATTPWFAKVFGPTSYELGGEMYGVQAAVSGFATEFQRRLPELRQMTPEEVGVAFNEISQAAMTGNQFTDALIQKNLMENAGPAMDQYYKARYAWQQEELSKAQNKAWLAAGAAFQETMANDAKLGRDHPGQAPDPEQQREAVRIFLQSFQSPATQNPESYLKNILTTVDQMADAGQWYSIRALEASGLFGAMSPEDQDKLQGRIDRARTKYKRTLANGPLMRPIAQLFSAARAGAVSAEQFVNGGMEINAQYAALTGDDTGLFDQADFIRGAESSAGAYYSMWERQMNRMESQREKAITAQEKEQAEARNDAALAAAVTTNSLGTVSKMKSVAADDADRAFNSVVDSSVAPGGPWVPQNLGEVAVGNYAVTSAGKEPFVSERMKTRLQAQVTNSAGEEWTDGFEAAYQNWQNIRYHTIERENGEQDRSSGLATAIEYYGPYAQRMQNYDDQRKAGVDRETAYRRTFGNEASFGQGDLRGIDSAATREARKSLDAAVSKINPSWWQLGSDSMGGSATNVVTAAASRYFEQIKLNDPAIGDTDAAQQAIQMAQANGLEISGRYAWQNIRGQKTLAAEAGMEKSMFERAFEQSLTNRFRAQGISVAKDTSVSIIRIGNDAAGPRLMATAYKDGVRKTIFLTGADLKKLRDDQAQRDRNRATQTDTSADRPDIEAGGFSVRPIL